VSWSGHTQQSFLRGKGLTGTAGPGSRAVTSTQHEVYREKWRPLVAYRAFSPLAHLGKRVPQVGHQRVGSHRDITVAEWGSLPSS
jgi:hypothetical protein